MDKLCKSLIEPSQSGFEFPALDETSINESFPDPITGMNAVHPSDPVGTRRCHSNATNHFDSTIESQAWPDHQAPGSKTVSSLEETAARAFPARSEISACLNPTAPLAISDSHAQSDNTKQKQLLLLAAFNRLLNPAIHSLPANFSHDGRRPAPPHHVGSSAISEPRRMPPSLPHPSPARRSAPAARPSPYADPRRIPADIAAIIAAAAASMAGPSPAPAGSLHPPPAASASADSAAMPPPPPRAPLPACGRCGRLGCGCEGGAAGRRRWPGAVEPLSLGPGDPDSFRPTARRRVCGGVTDPAGAAEAAVPL